MILATEKLLNTRIQNFDLWISNPFVLCSFCEYCTFLRYTKALFLLDSAFTLDQVIKCRILPLFFLSLQMI